jgi:hypothetical protein
VRRPPIRAARSSGTPGVETGRRWWNRITGAILTLGALAGAITAILSFWPSPDPEDRAEIKQPVQLTSVRPAKEYGQKSLAALRAQDEAAKRLKDQLLKDQLPECRETGSACKSLVVPKHLDPNKQPVPPDVAADRYGQMFPDARKDENGKSLGVVVSPDVELIGLRGKELLLSWRIWPKDSKTQLSDKWATSYPGCSLTPTTNHDTTTCDLWVPLPEPRGPYVIRFTLTAGQAILDSADSPPFL